MIAHERNHRQTKDIFIKEIIDIESEKTEMILGYQEHFLGNEIILAHPWFLSFHRLKGVDWCLYPVSGLYFFKRGSHSTKKLCMDVSVTKQRNGGTVATFGKFWKCNSIRMKIFGYFKKLFLVKSPSKYAFLFDQWLWFLTDGGLDENFGD